MSVTLRETASTYTNQSASQKKLFSSTNDSIISEMADGNEKFVSSLPSGHKGSRWSSYNLEIYAQVLKDCFSIPITISVLCEETWVVFRWTLPRGTTVDSATTANESLNSTSTSTMPQDDISAITTTVDSGLDSIV